MTQPTSAVANQPERADPRARLLEAFCSPASAEVFHPIVYQHDIWTADPFDVEEIHAEAREVFQRLLHRAGAEPPPKSGRVLLLKGQSGSGKTHLMRAFRNLTHGGELGYCGYLQMTSQTDNYARYLLSNLIDSLDQPYCLPDVPASGLSRLSLNLLEAVPGITPEDREAFQAGDITDLAERVERYADALLLERRVADPDLLDLVRALLFLQRDDPRVKSRVLKWLRCEDLTPGDRSWLGGLVPCNREEAPQQMIVRLGKLMAARGMPQVLCVDQLEDTYDQEKAAQQFRRAIDTLIAILDAVPTSVVVVSCLEDYFVAQRPHLIGSKLDRLERDPEPIGLTSQRTLEEIEALVARRLQHLYEEQGVPFGGQEPAFPFRREHLQRLVNLRTRDVLDYCRKHHERCVLAGQWVEPDGEVATPGAAEKGAETPTGEVEVLQALEQAWNDFHSSARVEVPDDEGTLAEVLAWAVAQCSEELPPEYHFAAEVVDGRMIPVELHFPGNAVDRLMVALCEKSPRGGGLSRQIGEVEKRAGEIPAVIVRSTDFPAGPKTEVAKQLARIIKGGGRRAVVENAHWRQMLA
ncbi:MAG TPA: hypothetical protein VIL46_10620, partial [Gemmataceae bacterium]